MKSLGPRKEIRLCSTEPSTWLSAIGASLKALLPVSARKDDLAFWFSELSGGPLSSRYRLEQFHMHWGVNDNEGSEHTVDGRSFAGEVRLHATYSLPVVQSLYFDFQARCRRVITYPHFSLPVEPVVFAS